MNKHNMVIFYKTWKKCNEIQLTKNKMVEQIENEKDKSLTSLGVATPQGRELIICINQNRIIIN